MKKTFHNLDPALHPLEKPREFVRALNAVKLDRMFARPFIGALSGHLDGVYCMTKHPTKVNLLASGAMDGGTLMWHCECLVLIRLIEIRIWDVAHKQTKWSTVAHTNFVRAITFDSTGSYMLSCGIDKLIKHWKLDRESIPTTTEVC